MTNEIIVLEDGFRILDINCVCGNHIHITHEDVVFHKCSCGIEHFNQAYYYYDQDGVINMNEYYWKEKDKKKFRY